MNRWQDPVLAAGSVVLGLSLIPTILDDPGVPVWTSALMVITLAIFTATFASMHLRITTVGMLGQVVAWAVVLGQGAW